MTGVVWLDRGALTLQIRPPRVNPVVIGQSDSGRVRADLGGGGFLKVADCIVRAAFRGIDNA